MKKRKIMHCGNCGLYQTYKNDDQCYKCGGNISCFCSKCSMWYSKDVIGKKNHSFEKCKGNMFKQEDFVLFTYFKGNTLSFIVQKDAKICDLLQIVFEEKDSRKYYMTTLEDNILCDESKNVAFYFENFQFFCLHEKDFLHYQIDNALDYLYCLLFKPMGKIIEKEKVLLLKSKIE
jgi:hypothetical protein